MSATASDSTPRDTPQKECYLLGETEIDSGKAFSRLLEGFAHKPAGKSTPTRLGGPNTKRKLDSPPGTERGARYQPSLKRAKKAEDDGWKDLRNVHDYLRPGLDVVFCGINPGQVSASAGRHFANPNNHFWGCLHESGFTNRRLDPSEDDTLPEQFNLGMTNLVERPTREAAELTSSELREEVPSLLSKMAYHKPKILCFVGVGIADVVSSYLALKKGRGRKQEKGKGGPGLIPFKLVYNNPREDDAEPGSTSETLLYAVSSTSGRVVAYKKEDKVKQFRAVKELLTTIHNGGCKASGDVVSVYHQDLGVP